MAVDPDKSKQDAAIPEKKDLVYTSCYCEENIYKFCERLKDLKVDLSNYFAVFISNKSKCVPVWCSKSSPNGVLMWDYHVILLFMDRKNVKACKFYDFDSNLEFPCAMMKYFEKTFQPNADLKVNYKQEFRLVQATQYLQAFYSDRMHMFEKSTNKWIMPPPSYDCIMNGHKNGSNLMSHFVDVTNLVIGKVFTVQQFEKWLKDGSGHPKQSKS